MAIVSNLYTKTCPVCLKQFTCVSSAGKYDTDVCRNKAFRVRKQKERDGRIKGITKLYDRALAVIAGQSKHAIDMFEYMSFCGRDSWSMCAAVFACYGLVVNHDPDPKTRTDYYCELQDSLRARVVLEQNKLMRLA